MNNRIEDLIPAPWPYQEENMFSYAQVINLATQIVKECAALVDDRCDPSEPWMDGATVLNHFGVEE